MEQMGKITTIYLKYLSDNPNTIICSYKLDNQLGGEFLGLPLWPDRYCPEDWAYAINDIELLKDK
jgi:hypothetical protein